MDQPMKFIITTNTDVAAKLQSSGLQLACSGTNFWEFVYDGKFMFDDMPDTKLTNKLLF